MIVTVWFLGENEPLARAELSAAAQRLGGRLLDAPRGESHRADVDVPDRAAAAALADRLGLARRCAERWPERGTDAIEARLRRRGVSGDSAAFQWISGSVGVRPPETLRQLGSVFRSEGGHISLEHPDIRFWLEPALDVPYTLYEEVGSVTRHKFSERRTPRLPFQRPVTLEPRYARALVNLGRVGPGDRVVDPFVGTGSLLLEAALLGADTVGIDASATMIRGVLENFARFDRTPVLLRQADAAEAAEEFPTASFDALVTDPPYGRASGTRGERPDRLWARTLPTWAEKVRPGGRMALILPKGAPPPAIPGRLELVIPQRVHRSLTREFRVYVREG